MQQQLDIVPDEQKSKLDIISEIVELHIQYDLFSSIHEVMEIMEKWEIEALLEFRDNIKEFLD